MANKFFAILFISILVAGLQGVPSNAAEAFLGTDPEFPPPTGDPRILSPGARLMRVFDRACALTEGVTAGHDGRVYFSDITFTDSCKDESETFAQAGNIWQYDPVTGVANIFRSPSGTSNGLEFDAQGDMIAALGADRGGRMLVKTDMESGRSYILTATFDDSPYNAPNDLTIDEQGRIYFSDPRFVGDEPINQSGFAVYRLDTDGSVERIITDAGKPNGVQVSPDQSTLYVSSLDFGWLDFQGLEEDDDAPVLGFNALLAYELSEDGTVGNRRVLVDYSPYSGPDGLTTDSEGNIYAALTSEIRLGVAVYDPLGNEIAFIPTGEDPPTNVGFGRGGESNVLFVTAGTSLYRIEMAISGYQLPVRN